TVLLQKFLIRLFRSPVAPSLFHPQPATTYSRRAWTSFLNARCCLQGWYSAASSTSVSAAFRAICRLSPHTHNARIAGHRFAGATTFPCSVGSSCVDDAAIVDFPSPCPIRQ